MSRKKILASLLTAGILAGGMSVATVHNTPNTTSRNTVSNVRMLSSRSASIGCVVNGTGNLAVTNNDGQIVGYTSVGQMLRLGQTKGDTTHVIVEETGVSGYINNSNIKDVTSGIGQSITRMNRRGYIINVSSDVHVRQEATMDSTVLANLSNGTNVTITGQQGNWFRVSVNGVKGFVFGEYVGEGNTANGGIVTVPNGTVYGQTSKGNKVVVVKNLGGVQPVNVNNNNGTQQSNPVVVNNNGGQTVINNNEGNKVVKHVVVKSNHETNKIVKPEVTGNKTVKPENTNEGNKTVKPEVTGNKTVKPENTNDGNKTVKPENTNEGHKVVKPENTNDGNKTIKPSNVNDGNKTVKPETKNDGHKEVKPETKNEGHKTVKPENTNEGNKTVKPENKNDGNKVSTPKAMLHAYIANCKEVYLNEAPSANTKHLTVLKDGQKIEVIGSNGSWLKVKDGDLVGYVYHTYISTSAPTSVPTVKPHSTKTPDSEHHTGTVTKPHNTNTPDSQHPEVTHNKPEVVKPVNKDNHNNKPEVKPEVVKPVNKDNHKENKPEVKPEVVKPANTGNHNNKPEVVKPENHNNKPVNKPEVKPEVVKPVNHNNGNTTPAPVVKPENNNNGNTTPTPVVKPENNNNGNTTPTPVVKPSSHTGVTDAQLQQQALNTLNEWRSMFNEKPLYISNAGQQAAEQLLQHDVATGNKQDEVIGEYVSDTSWASCNGQEGFNLAMNGFKESAAHFHNLTNQINKNYGVGIAVSQQNGQTYIVIMSNVVQGNQSNSGNLF